jgi:pimeloyl-ACP methyl ester carboxylesterase
MILAMTVVFMAPVGNDAGAWWQVAAAQRGTRHEFPGFGRPRADAPPTMASLADEVAAAYAPPLHLIGVSMGGMVALNVAVRHPDRVGSVLVACTGAAVDPAVMHERARAALRDGMEGVLDTTLERWFTPAAVSQSPAHPGVQYARATLRSLDPASFADGWRAIATHDVRERLAELSMPITAAAGSLDQASPLARSEEIAARAPRARLVIVDGAPHMAHLECPARLSEVVDDHLSWAQAD